MKQERFLEIFNLLRLNYSQEVPNEIIKLWYEEFENYSEEEFERGVIKYIKDKKTFPTINEIKEYAYEKPIL